jgi:hypothetical protein
MGPRRVLDTKIYWLTNLQSQYDFGFDFDLVLRYSPTSKNVNTEVEEVTMLEAVSRRQPVKLQ